jgi:hypothetical protein
VPLLSINKTGVNLMRFRINIIAVLMLLLGVNAMVFARAATQTGYSQDRIFNPADVRIIDLNASSLGAEDSIGPDSQVVYGPISLSTSSNEPMYSGFKVTFTGGTVTSGDSVSIAYQIINGSNLSDTVASGWTPIDTVINAAEDTPWTSLSSEAGRAIVLRIYGEDSTVSVISGKIQLVLKRGGTWNAKME